MVLKMPYVCDSTINLRRKQAQLIQKYAQKKQEVMKKTNLAVVRPTVVQVTGISKLGL
jgi:hypothetical protein